MERRHFRAEGYILFLPLSSLTHPLGGNEGGHFIGMQTTNVRNISARLTSCFLRFPNLVQQLIVACKGDEKKERGIMKFQVRTLQ